MSGILHFIIFSMAAVNQIIYFYLDFISADAFIIIFIILQLNDGNHCQTKFF